MAAHTSSTYRSQKHGYTMEVDSARYSRSSITRFVITADTGEPIAVPKICW